MFEDIKKETTQTDFFKNIDSLDNLRDQSSYNTGSISSTTAWLLYSTTLFFKPEKILEIGSFIGKSTFSMAYAADKIVPAHLEETKDRRLRMVDATRRAVHERLTKEINHWTHRYNELKAASDAGKQPRMQPENARRRAGRPGPN